MRRIKRTFVKKEKKEVWIVRQNKNKQASRRPVFWCRECQADVEWLSLTDALKISSSSLRGIFRFIEAGSVHIRENPGTQPFFCANSLAIISRF